MRRGLFRLGISYKALSPIRSGAFWHRCASSGKLSAWLKSRVGVSVSRGGLRGRKVLRVRRVLLVPPGLLGRRDRQVRRQVVLALPGYEPQFWASCVVALDIISLNANGGVQRVADGRAETYLLHGADLQQRGRRCSVLGSNRQLSGFGGGYYPGVTMGAITGGCDASADYPPDGTEGGFFYFTANSGLKATYTTLTILCNSICTATRFLTLSAT
jgi:hypothetical protein